MPNLIAISLLVWSLTAFQPNPRELTSAEEKALPQAAEQSLKAQTLWQGKIYQTNCEVILDTNANPPERYALLTFYRYEGNLAILVTVRLDKMTVTSVQSRPNMPTSLAPEEIAAAKKIARDHPEIQKALTRYKHLDKIEIDTIVAQIINAEVPGYHHRVVRCFFRDERRNYLAGVPMVDIDLTTGEVRFDLIRKMHGK